MRLQTTQSAIRHSVSSGNPCPFLRALVADGTLADDIEPIGEIATKLVDVAKKGEGAPTLPATGIHAIALSANGMGFSKISHNFKHGMQLSALRSGPYDKQGAGSRILAATGVVDLNELKRLGDFASEKATPGGAKEQGLSLAELKTFMDANFDRAAGRRRLIDRLIMNGEWPILLKVMGKESVAGRYLSLADVNELFVRQLLPERMTVQTPQTLPVPQPF